MGFVPSPGTTARAIVNIISEKWRQKYQFSEEWEGCRCWNLVLIGDMEISRLIPHGSAALIKEALSFYWVFSEGKVSRALQQESFRA